MPNVNPEDVIWIKDAATQFERSRKWLDEQIAVGNLSVVKKAGDLKVYLLRSEITALIDPQIKQPRRMEAG